MREKLMQIIASKHELLINLNTSIPKLFKLAEHLIANDVVQVVRCKNCTYGKLDDVAWCHDVYGRENDTSLYHCLCGFGHNKADHFCSYGERRTDG